MTKERTWKEIAEELERNVNLLITSRNVINNIGYQANLARLTTECQQRDKDEKGNLKTDEQDWKDVAMEYVKVNQLKVASKNVVTIAGLDKDNVRIGKKLKAKKEKAEKAKI